MKKVILMFFCLTCGSALHAAAINSAVKGSWDLGANWSSGSVPVQTDDIFIAHTITYTGSLDGSGYHSLTIKAGGKLIVTSNFILRDGHAIHIETGGTLMVQGSIAPATNETIHNSGTLIVTNNLSVSFGNVSTNANGATISIGTNLLSSNNEVVNLEEESELSNNNSVAVSSCLANGVISFVVNEIQAKIIAVEVINLQGVSLAKATVLSNEANILVDSFAAGYYIAKLRLEDNSAQIVKFVK